jgi:hypothetical protein
MLTPSVATNSTLEFYRLYCLCSQAAARQKLTLNHNLILSSRRLGNIYMLFTCHVLPEGRWCTSPAVRLLHDYIATSHATTRYTVAEVHRSGVLKFIGSM